MDNEAEIIFLFRRMAGATISLLLAVLIYSVPAKAQEATLTQSLEQIAIAADQSNWAHAAEIAKRSKDPLFASQALAALKIYYTPDKYTANELISFFAKASWLPESVFHSRVERSLKPSLPIEQLRNWYAAHEPITQYGKLVASFVSTSGAISNQNAAPLITHWKKTKLDNEDETFFIKSFKSNLSNQDLMNKVEFYIWSADYEKANALIEYLPSNLAQTAKDQLKLAKKPELLKKYLVQSKDFASTSELTKYLAIKYLIDNSHEDHAISLLKNTPTSINTDKWYSIRNRLARYCLQNGDFEDAYKIISKHNLTEGNDFVEAEFLSGWISLRFLKNPQGALRHFINMADQASFSSSKAKAHYWLYKTYMQLGKSEKENYHLEQAALFQGNFYGMLALAELKKHSNINYFSKESSDFTKDDSDAIKKLTLFVSATRKAKIEPLSRDLINSMAETNTDSATLITVLKFLKARNLNSLAVELGTRANLKQGYVFDYGFPNQLPVDESFDNKALYLAIIRQESYFNQEATSPTGAKGLMQLMPDTAALMAKKLGLPKNGYITSSKLNFLKGSAYVDNLIDNFGGSQILAIAAYNAGPGNVKKWVNKYGDPRGKSQDFVIDWLELIPFAETRLYVKKVLENYMIYECLENNKSLPADRIFEVFQNG